MGWLPNEVRACMIGDFLCAYNGWARSKGAKDETRLPDKDERAQMKANMDRMKADGLLPDDPGQHTDAAIGIEELLAHGAH